MIKRIVGLLVEQELQNEWEELAITPRLPVWGCATTAVSLQEAFLWISARLCCCFGGGGGGGVQDNGNRGGVHVAGDGNRCWLPGSRGAKLHCLLEMYVLLAEALPQVRIMLFWTDKEAV